MDARKYVQPSKTSLFNNMRTIGLSDETIEFALNEDGTYELNATELFEVFRFLNSPQFEEYIQALNDLETKEAKMHEAYANAYSKLQEGTMNDDDLYEVAATGRRYGRYDEFVYNLKRELQNSVSWSCWIDACRVYESLTGIPREWL